MKHNMYMTSPFEPLFLLNNGAGWLFSETKLFTYSWNTQTIKLNDFCVLNRGLGSGLQLRFLERPVFSKV